MGTTGRPEERKPRQDTDAPAITESDEDCDATVTIEPPAEKVGEGEDNLERREEWFRKRSRG